MADVTISTEGMDLSPRKPGEHQVSLAPENLTPKPRGAHKMGITTGDLEPLVPGKPAKPKAAAIEFRQRIGPFDEPESESEVLYDFALTLRGNTFFALGLTRSEVEAYETRAESLGEAEKERAALVQSYKTEGAKMQKDGAKRREKDPNDPLEDLYARERELQEQIRVKNDEVTATSSESCNDILSGHLVGYLPGKGKGRPLTDEQVRAMNLDYRGELLQELVAQSTLNRGETDFLGEPLTVGLTKDS